MLTVGHRGLHVNAVMGAVVVVVPLEGNQFAVDRADGQRPVVTVIELAAGGAVGPLYAAVEVGAVRRQDEEGDAEVATGLFELGHELAAAVHLDGGDVEGGLTPQAAQEVAGVAGGGSAVGAHDGEAGEGGRFPPVACSYHP